MKITYEVKVRSFEEVHELPNSWSNEEFKEILEEADFDDVDELDPDELRSYTIMALQELEADEAAELVLNYKLGDKLSKGQIQNLSNEMMDEKLWEEYTDINLHNELYDCSVLLKWAFPGRFPETDAVKCTIEVASGSLEPLAGINKTFLTRLLAQGMDDHAIINRLFDKQVNGAPFPEAEGIIWQFEAAESLDKTLITIYSSNYWLHSMDEVDHYVSEAISH
ncbi:hypothetical protein [Ekhidna sp. To15]|uniref:hypothetical protein n=1 Tax=Ekhidna sp. To15 TaxID=3395267 RepID=UPI003F526EAD